MTEASKDKMVKVRLKAGQYHNTRDVNGKMQKYGPGESLSVTVKASKAFADKFEDPAILEAQMKAAADQKAAEEEEAAAAVKAKAATQTSNPNPTQPAPAPAPAPAKPAAGK